MNIGVLGPGAMGCLYGARLALSGQNVTMIGRNVAKMQHLRQQGIILEEDGICKIARVNALTADQMAEPLDLLILFTKTIQAEKAMRSVKHLIGPDTFLMSLQNGLGNERFLLPYSDSARILIGSCIFPGDLKEPGHVVTQKDGETKFAVLDGSRSDRAEEIAEAFNKAGLNCSIDQNVFQRIWEKTALNCAMNCLTAICGVPCGVINDVPGGRELAYAVIDEVVQTAKDCGFKLSREHIQKMVEFSFVEHKNHYTSMAQDIMNHRPTEADLLCGEVISRAHQHNRSVPHLETLKTIINIIEYNAATQQSLYFEEPHARRA